MRKGAPKEYPKDVAGCCNISNLKDQLEVAEAASPTTQSDKIQRKCLQVLISIQLLRYLVFPVSIQTHPLILLQAHSCVLCTL